MRQRHMIKNYVLIISFLIFPLLNSCHLLNERQLWAPNCEKLKKDFLVDKSFNIMFTNKPIIKIERTPLTIFWNNIEVSVPNVEYKDIYVSLNNKNEYEIWLRTIDDLIISLMVTEDEVMEDVFAETSVKGKLITSLEGISATKDMFGGPAKISTVMKLAYNSTPDLLTCREENRINESAIAIALIFKGTLNSDLMAAYEDIGEYDGWITKSGDGNKIEYALNIMPADTNNQLFYITYRMPEGSKYEYLPFCVGSKIETVKDTPSWLVSLNNAIEMKTNDSWEEFISAAKRIGISEKSISKTCENLNLKPKT